MNLLATSVCSPVPARPACSLGPLVLVNRHFPLPAQPSPVLAAPCAAYAQVTMEAQAAKMLAACLQVVGGSGRILPVSGWRSRAQQQEIWEDTLASQGETFARQYVALPGCSEHETGLAMDLALAADHIDFIRPYFPYDGVCQDFRRAAPRYGLIQRYQGCKESITGIAREPWHFRYVGIPHAGFMVRQNLCLEEYLELVAAGPLRFTLEDGRQIRVFRVERLEDLASCRFPRQISGDNRGGFVVTQWEVAP